TPTPPPSGGGSLRMMTWNIQSGKGLNGVYDPWSQSQFMAAQHPDVIVLEEVSHWGGDDAPLYRDLLQQYTGQTWYYYEADPSSCSTSGCIVEEILSRYPIQSSSTLVSGPTAFAQVGINVGGVPLNIFSTHIDYYDTSLRTSELLAMMGWASNFSGPR